MARGRSEEEKMVLVARLAVAALVALFLLAGGAGGYALGWWRFVGSVTESIDAADDGRDRPVAP